MFRHLLPGGSTGDIKEALPFRRPSHISQGSAASLPVVIGREGVAHSALSIHQLENANLHTNLHSDSCHTGRRLEVRLDKSETEYSMWDSSLARIRRSGEGRDGRSGATKFPLKQIVVKAFV